MNLSYEEFVTLARKYRLWTHYKGQPKEYYTFEQETDLWSKYIDLQFIFDSLNEFLIGEFPELTLVQYLKIYSLVEHNRGSSIEDNFEHFIIEKSIKLDKLYDMMKDLELL